MTKSHYKKIIIEEVQKYTSVDDFFDKEHQSERSFFAKKLYYSALHVMKTCLDMTYREFDITDRHGMMNAVDYSKKNKAYRKEVNKVMGIISERIKSERNAVKQLN